jgi:ER lumen protein retaining receptor
LILLRQTNVPTVIDSYYLVLLGSYRALYILNWIARIADKSERHFDPIAVIFGIIQTILYADFAWVYYSRQRVKLRAGGIVDSDDLERGFFVGRLVGKKPQDDDEDDEEGDSVSGARNRGGRWGARGISVSADEDFDASGEDARPLADPSAFEDESDDEEASSSKKDSKQPLVPREHDAEEASAWSETETTAR